MPIYYLISGVGNTCGTFMSFMHKYFNTTIKFADYATNIHLELYLENNDGENINENNYRIEYYFNDEFLLSIPYKEFKSKFEKELYDTSNITEFCEKEEKKENDNKEKLYYIGIFVGLGIVIILVIIIIIVLRKRIKKNNEEQLAEESDALIRESKMSAE